MNQPRKIRQELFLQRLRSKTGRQKAKTSAEKMAIIHLVLLLCLVASSCSFSNPILGKWRPKPTKERIVIAARNIEFTEAQIIYEDGIDPSDRIPVEYKISGSEVTVTPKAGLTIPFVCSATEGDTITCDLPVVGKTVYVRREK